MKFLRLLLAVALACFSAMTAAGQYDWVIQKLPKSLEEVDTATFTVGTIGEQKYLAIHMNIGAETQDGFKPALVFARIRKDKTYDPFEVIELPNLLDLSVQIKNESIYIRHDTAHHGIYSSTYQFKFQNGGFQLVGMERQSMTSSGTEKNIDLWAGQSVNLLTSEAIYWAQAFDMDKPKERTEWEKALRRHAQGLPSTKGKTRTVKLRLGSRWDLEHFDPYNFDLKFLCHYFDHNLRFQNVCK